MNFFLKNMLQGGEMICPIVRTECNSFLDHLDFHPHYELYFCHGSLLQRMFINGQEYTVSEPNVVILPPFAVHHISSGESVRSFERFVVYFGEELLSQFGASVLSDTLRSSFDGTLFRLSAEGADTLLSALQSVYAEGATRAEQATALATVLNRLDRLTDSERRMQFPMLNEETPRILEYIYRNVGADLDADRIAVRFNISRAKLDRDFRRYVGRTVHQTVIDCRLSAAIALLRRSDSSVGEIALRCGFESEYYFYAFCKRNTGMTPTELRRIGDSLTEIIPYSSSERNHKTDQSLAEN